MSVLQPKGLVSHERKADRCLYRGSAPDIVNVVGHLRWASLKLGEGSTRLVSLQLICPLSSSTMPDPDLVPRGSSEAERFKDRCLLSPPANQWPRLLETFPQHSRR